MITEVEVIGVVAAEVADEDEGGEEVLHELGETKDPKSTMTLHWCLCL